jgi:aryl-alcohol dehydrogenase-like predicted oxidoreductase
VQNLYNLTNRSSAGVLDFCAENGIGFIPWIPIASGALAGADSPVASIARSNGATPAQLALAWLLRRSPVMLPIPGTSKVDHLEENMKAADVTLSDADYEALTALA